MGPKIDVHVCVCVCVCVYVCVCVCVCVLPVPYMCAPVVLIQQPLYGDSKTAVIPR